MKLKLLLLLLIHYLFFLPDICAQWRADTIAGGKMVVKQTSYSDRFFTIADTTGGSMYIFFQLVQNQQGGADYALKMQRCDHEGNLQAGTVDSGLTIQSRITDLFDAVSDGAGGAYILYALWSPETHSDDSVYLYLQHINSNGNKLWAEFGKPVKVQHTDFDFEGKLLLYNDKSVAVVFSSAAYGDNGYGQLSAQKYNSTGSTLWAPGNLAVCTAAEKRGMYYITDDGSGGLLVVFEDGRNGTFSGNSYNNLDIFMQHINANGVLANNAAGAGIITASSYQSLYVEKPGDKYIYPDGTGGCYFLYESVAMNNPDVKEIYVQRINATGEAVWAGAGTWIARSDYSGRNVYAVDMDAAPSGQLSVLYNTSDGTGYYDDPTELRLQTINNAGSVQYTPGIGKKIATVFNTGYREYSAPFDIKYAFNGEAIIVFNYKADSLQLHLQKIKTDGTLTWDSAGKLIIRQAAYMPQILKSNNNNYLLRWFDRRNYGEWVEDGKGDMFVNPFDVNGTFFSSRTRIVSAGNGAWNTPSTWVGNIVPGPNDIVVITNAVTVTAAASCYSLSVLPPAGNIIVQTGISLNVLH